MPPCKQPAGNTLGRLLLVGCAHVLASPTADRALCPQPHLGHGPLCCGNPPPRLCEGCPCPGHLPDCPARWWRAWAAPASCPGFRTPAVWPGLLRLDQGQDTPLASSLCPRLSDSSPGSSPLAQAWPSRTLSQMTSLASAPRLSTQALDVSPCVLLPGAPGAHLTSKPRGSRAGTPGRAHWTPRLASRRGNLRAGRPPQLLDRRAGSQPSPPASAHLQLSACNGRLRRGLATGSPDPRQALTWNALPGPGVARRGKQSQHS